MAIPTFWRKQRTRKADRRTIANSVEAPAILPYRQSLSILSQEIARGRRFQSPLIIATVDLNGHHVENEDQSMGEIGQHPDKASSANLWAKFEFAFCGPVFRDSLREIDIATYDHVHDPFVIALPETSKPQAIQTFDRQKKVIASSIITKGSSIIKIRYTLILRVEGGQNFLGRLLHSKVSTIFHGDP